MWVFNLVIYSCYLSGRIFEIKSRIATAKAAFNREKTFFTRQLDLNLRKDLVKCYIWSIILYRPEIWILRKVDHKYLERFYIWCWRMMEKISWTDHARNEEVLDRVKEERDTLY